MATQAPPFDTHRTIECLINSGGFDKKQAEAIAEAANNGLTGGVATNTDIETLGTHLRAEIRATIAELETRMIKLETRLTNQTWKIVLIGAGLVAGSIAYATNLILSAIAG